MRASFFRFTLPVAVGLSLAACGGPVGSCLFPTEAGYDYCQDFLGTEFNSSVAQNTCENGNGTYSSSPCSTAGALGTCAVGSGTADDYLYTYTAAGGASVPPTTIESACGVSGGTFSAG